MTDTDSKVTENIDPRRAANEPPNKGTINRAPNVAPPPPPPPPFVEAASQSGRHPVHDPLPRAQRARR